MRSFIVNDNDSGQRLDKFVTKTVRGLPASLMYKYIRKKRIKINGRRASADERISNGDTVEMYIPDEFFKSCTASAELSRATVRLNVVYEDENLILVDKRPGVLVHPGDEGDRSLNDEAERATLIFAIKAHLAERGEYQPDKENSFSPALCNRIDRNTGGIVIAAKNARTLRALNEAIRNREIEKHYLCAVHGIPERREATLRAYLMKDHRANRVRVTYEHRPGSKEIITGYRVLSENRDLNMALLEVMLMTGRTHQIRAHLAHEGYPLVGDGKYGLNGADRKLGYKYQALTSYKLIFRSHRAELDYLYGREFCVPRDSIFFLELFDLSVEEGRKKG